MTCFICYRIHNESTSENNEDCQTNKDIEKLKN